MPSIQGQVGPQILGTSAVPATPSMSPNGGLVTQDEHGRFYEAVRRGGVYTLSTAAAGITVAAGNVSPLTANTGIPIIGLFNPVNSGYNLVIMRTKIQTVSGTPGGGFVWNVVAPNDPITVTPGSKGINNKTFVQGGVAIGFSNSAFTGSVVGTMFRPIGGTAAVASGAGVYSVDEITDGDIVIPPGGFAGIAATAAGTTHVVAASVTWEEVVFGLSFDWPLSPWQSRLGGGGQRLVIEYGAHDDRTAFRLVPARRGRLRAESRPRHHAAHRVAPLAGDVDRVRARQARPHATDEDRARQPGARHQRHRRAAVGPARNGCRRVWQDHG